MLLQSLLLVATLTIIGSALLTSTLVSAKAKFHSAIVETGRSAMTDATADFVAWTQSNIRDNGIDQLAVWAAKPQTSNRQPACDGTTSAPIGTASSDCKLYQSIEWNVTGYTDAANQFKSTFAGSEATNLATAQNERRISATINISITDSTGSKTYSRQSREITARIFHASPYVAVTGELDASSETGSIMLAEGDTAGFNGNYKDRGVLNPFPTSAEPANITDTTLLTTIDCNNSADNSSSNPQHDNHNVKFARIRAFGNLAWTYEVPCESALAVDPDTTPVGYQPSIDNTYGSQKSYDDNWKKNDDNQSTFAR